MRAARALQRDAGPAAEVFDGLCRGTVDVAAARQCRPDGVVGALQPGCQRVLGHDVLELAGTRARAGQRVTGWEGKVVPEPVSIMIYAPSSTVPRAVQRTRSSWPPGLRSDWRKARCEAGSGIEQSTCTGPCGKKEGRKVPVGDQQGQGRSAKRS